MGVKKLLKFLTDYSGIVCETKIYERFKGISCCKTSIGTLLKQ